MHLNDVHSALNPTRVLGVATPVSVDDLIEIVRTSPRREVSIGGGRHSMGGQQFATDALHIDMRGMCRVHRLDSARGLVVADAGIQWPALVHGIRERSVGDATAWGIRQKQTGASDLTLGGALSANAHGRGLTMGPIVDDVEAFTLIDAKGERWHCSRDENADLFARAIGGYGLFGIIAEVTLRLSPRRKVRRCVDTIATDDAMARFNDEIALGTLYGDYQFDIDHRSETFLQRGIFSRYRPVPEDTVIPHGQRVFTPELWLSLIGLARTDKSAAYDRYVEHYLSTSGQVYWSDTHQLSTYVPGYHSLLAGLPPEAAGTEMITEVYVPRPRYSRFMALAADQLRVHDARITYGTTRLIEADRCTALPWAREAFACTVFNVLTAHTAEGVARSRATCRALIDVALSLGGTFFLTYHRWATRDQLLSGYPDLPEFLASKARWDPSGRFVSDWHGGIREILGIT